MWLVAPIGSSSSAELGLLFLFLLYQLYLIIGINTNNILYKYQLYLIIGITESCLQMGMFHNAFFLIYVFQFFLIWPLYAELTTLMKIGTLSSVSSVSAVILVCGAWQILKECPTKRGGCRALCKAWGINSMP